LNFLWGSGLGFVIKSPSLAETKEKRAGRIIEAYKEVTGAFKAIVKLGSSYENRPVVEIKARVSGKLDYAPASCAPVPDCAKAPPAK